MWQTQYTAILRIRHIELMCICHISSDKCHWMIALAWRNMGNTGRASAMTAMRYARLGVLPSVPGRGFRCPRPSGMEYRSVAFGPIQRSCAVGGAADLPPLPHLPESLHRPCCDMIRIGSLREDKPNGCLAAAPR
jgi:hypothetical protein